MAGVFGYEQEDGEGEGSVKICGDVPDTTDAYIPKQAEYFSLNDGPSVRIRPGDWGLVSGGGDTARVDNNLDGTQTWEFQRAVKLPKNPK